MIEKYKLTPDQAARAEKLRKMSPDVYEKICKGCGTCCLCKVGDENLVFYTDLCCDHLDIKTKRCNIYKKRLDVCRGDCSKVTVDLVLKGDLVPRTCGYVEYIFGKAPHPVNVDWSQVKHCGNIDLDQPHIALNHVLFESINWKQR